jgi:drug/metabolite transporter (DMT)-like permease
MNATALILVISGAALHALWNVAAKKASGGLAFVWLFGLVSLLPAIPFGFAAWHDHAQQLTLPAWTAIAGSAAIHVVYSLVLQRGYRDSDFSIVYPLARGTGPLFAVLGAIVFLGESPSLLGWLGIGSVLVGIVLISGAAQVFAVRSARARAGLRWGIATGACIALYTLIDGWAVKMLGIAPLLYYCIGLAVRAVLLAPQALADRAELNRQWRTNRRYVFCVGLLSPLAYLLILVAMTMAPLSYVAPVRELSMLLGVLFGARLLREAFSASRAIGTACMVTGVLMLAQA